MNEIQIPDFLIKCLAKGEVVPLIGAGVSMSVKNKEGSKVFPSWPQLLENAASNLDGEDSQLVKLQVKRGKLQRAAEEAQELLSGRPWHDFITSQFSINFKELDDSCKMLPKAIWQLSNRVVTLNYDKVLEWAHDESANICAFDNANHEQLAEFARPSDQEMLWHLHGKIDQPKHMVLTPQSYHRLYQENAEDHYEAALVKFRDLISSKHILFIGCSLDDAELLAEIVKQNKLFDGNTGPHYALVREKDKQAIDAKLEGSHVQTIPFHDFGQPLIDAVNQLAECKNKQQQLVVTLEKSAPKTEKEIEAFDQIALFTASPLDKSVNDSDIIAKLKRFKYPICQQAFTESNLMDADDYSILFLIAKKTGNGLLIEDGNACSDYLAINELESSLPVNAKLTVLITDKLFSEQELEQISFPLLILPLLNKQGKELKALDRLTHQLFKKPNVKAFDGKDEIQSVQITNELLQLFNLENKQYWLTHQPKLPKDINSSALQGFTGRLSDLADISQKLDKAVSGKRLLTIKGSGGLGKTTIAKKVALELACRGYFEAGVYFIDCESISSANQLEIHISEAFNLLNADDLFDYLAKHHDQQSRLLIFDNLESLLHLKQADKSQNKQAIEQVKELLSQTLLYASVLVTSRESINTEWEDVFPFRQMESEEALTLFNHLTKDSYSSENEQRFARRKILEPLLNNNPLAIKLICDGMPKGKSLKELQQELEDDFFGKVKEEDLILMFDDEVDANINRQESLYVSILYSYKTLSDTQKRTFESFSLFPDGIDLGTFKRMVDKSKGNDRNEDVHKLKKPVSDKDISVLTNKSLVEVYNSYYTLQSVIQRFSCFQFEQHTPIKDKLELFKQAFIYNSQLVNYLDDTYKLNKKSIPMIVSTFNNLLAAMSYGAKKNVVQTKEEAEDYFYMVDLICNFATNLNLIPDFLATFNEIDIEHLITESNDKSRRLAWQLIEVNAIYYKGEFDIAYERLKELCSNDSLMAISGRAGSGSAFERVFYNSAQNIYVMEGEVFNRFLHDVKFNVHRFIFMCNYNVQMGMNVEPLLSLVIPDLSYFEAQYYSSAGVNQEQLNKTIDGLHDSEHLARVSLIYIKSRDVHVNEEFIDKLVNMNPFTKGLKKLMYAFSCEYMLRTDTDNVVIINNIIDYYESALTGVKHIKFYYMQALYFYSRLLKQIGHESFEQIYKQGLALTIKHHYRYWQHKFLLLKQPSLGVYKAEDYPLPGDPDISELIEKNAKWLKKNYGTSLNPFY